MSEVLDRKRPYSPVQGDSRAKYYQDGKYFYADGTLLRPEDAGKPSDTGSFANQVQAGVDEEIAKQNAKKPLKLVDNTNPHTNSQADIDAARKRSQRKGEPGPVADSPGGVEPEVVEDRAAVLKGLHVTELRKMVAGLGLTPVTGIGSKQKNIQLLLDNTE